ncbi:hypothetical protein FE840_005860 [Peteryoungia desertarenae]|uniref:Uncharacterized protein n=1 Tax=Peteryoungia desertarenae TaxID=1813451 RepID=A0ABX6QKT6_9HYPH|nr:hypothetical protein [Peteryoungia desertarenae]QLF69099.1 hypothetical protein FE840_005860 [Peteryoungia desertarenae]
MRTSTLGFIHRSGGYLTGGRSLPTSCSKLQQGRWRFGRKPARLDPMVDHIIDHFDSYAAIYVLAQLTALWWMRGWWRAAALVPLVPMVAVVALVIAASGSGGNVTPVLLFFLLPPALIYILVLHMVVFIVRWRSRPG